MILPKNCTLWLCSKCTDNLSEQITQEVQSRTTGLAQISNCSISAMTTVSRFVSCEDECEELDGKTDEVCTSHDFSGNVTWSIKQDRTCHSNFPLRNFISFWHVSHTWLRYARVCVKIKIHPLSLPRGHTSHNFRWALLESVKLSNIWLYCVSVAQLRATRDRFRSVRRSDPVALKKFISRKTTFPDYFWSLCR